jgi:hypothetical protein
MKTIVVNKVGREQTLKTRLANLQGDEGNDIDPDARLRMASLPAAD